MKIIPYEYQISDFCVGGLFFSLPEEIGLSIYLSQNERCKTFRLLIYILCA
jgi:hypothetical protein